MLVQLTYLFELLCNTLHIQAFLLKVLLLLYNSLAVNVAKIQRRVCVHPIKNNRHFLKGITASLWVVEERRKTIGGTHDNKYKIVLPADGLEREGIDKCVEEDSSNGRDIRDGKTAGPQLVRPYLASVRDKERSTAKAVSFEGSKITAPTTSGLGGSLQSNIVTRKEDEQEWDNC